MVVTKQSIFNGSLFNDLKSCYLWCQVYKKRSSVPEVGTRDSSVVLGESKGERG